MIQNYVLDEGISDSVKILHVIRSINPTTGGPAFAVMQMAKALADGGISIDIATTDYYSNDKESSSVTVPTVQDGFRFFCFPRQMMAHGVFLGSY